MTSVLTRAVWLFIVTQLSVFSSVSAQGLPKSAAPPAKTLQTRVWVNNSTRVYHCPGTPFYGATQNGEFMEEAQARGYGIRAVGGRGCGNVVTSGRAPLPDSAPATKRMVWVNTESGVYHCPNSSNWGQTRRGRYLSEAAASTAGHKPAGGKKCEVP